MNSLRYISISHKSATLAGRERYHFSAKEKKNLIDSLRDKFGGIDGLLVLVTCNRTEVYFESAGVSASEMRDFLIASTMGEVIESEIPLIRISDTTRETVLQLLEVSSGLASSVLGDAEIIHQIRMAYRQSCELQLQGSLLERSMQTIFRAHKRISNETGFRDGTTSVAYKSLKLIANSFGKSGKKQAKILFIGAGNIVKQLLNYNNKFGFSSVFIANRTAEKAEELTQKYGGDTIPWEQVLANEFNDFSVIVSAVSNRTNIVHSITEKNRKTLLIDLAVPGNINNRLSEESHIELYNLDSIAKVLDENRHQRLESIEQVQEIIYEGLMEYLTWLEAAPKRIQMAQYKNEVDRWVQDYLREKGIQLSNSKLKTATNRIVRKSYKKNGVAIPVREMESILVEHLY